MQNILPYFYDIVLEGCHELTLTIGCQRLWSPRQIAEPRIKCKPFIKERSPGDRVREWGKWVLERGSAIQGVGGGQVKAHTQLNPGEFCATLRQRNWALILPDQ